MSLPEIVPRDEWLVARTQLLAKEKEATQARDALNAERRRLPMVRIDKEYVFVGPDGKSGLIDLFEGRRQLFVQHFMFDPSWDEGCHTYSAYARGTDQLSSTYQLLDLTPLGRQEGWGDAPDRGGEGVDWLRHDDRYEG